MAGKNLFWYMDGLGSLSEIMFRIYIDGDYLCLDNVKPHMIGGDKVLQQYKINTEDILDLGIVKVSELKKQSVVGRGVVGGLLFGPVGAVLGGMSATGKQKIKSTLAICYLPSSGDDPKTIVFNAEPPSWGGQNISSATKMKNELAKRPKSERVVRYLGQIVNEDGSITL